MAIKPRENLSPAYLRRIERAEAKGLSRQAARGHKQHEHIERKQKEVAKSGLTSGQKAQIKKYTARQVDRNNQQRGVPKVDFKTEYDANLKRFANHYPAFQTLQKVNNKNVRYLASKRYKRRENFDLEEQYEDEIDEEPMKLPEFMFYYH